MSMLTKLTTPLYTCFIHMLSLPPSRLWHPYIYISITFFDHATLSFPTAVNTYISEPQKNQHGISILECTWRCVYLKSILNGPNNHNFVACMWRCTNLKYMINTNQGINIEYVLSEYAWKCTYLTYITRECQVKRPTWNIWYMWRCTYLKDKINKPKKWTWECIYCQNLGVDICIWKT